MTVLWRAMAVSDLPDVTRIADTVHVDYPESESVFAERLRLFPAGCRVAVEDRDLVGYGVMHPGRVGRPPGLDAALGGLPADADCLYIHDIALLPGARRHGLGKAALAHAHAAAAAAGLPLLALIATPGAFAYWKRLGFVVHDGGPELQRKLASYGPGLVYMTMPAAR